MTETDPLAAVEAAARAILEKDAKALDNPKTFGARLGDRAPAAKRDIRILAQTLADGAAGQLRAASGDRTLLKAQFAKRLEDQHGFRDDLARWAVDVVDRLIHGGAAPAAPIAPAPVSVPQPVDLTVAAPVPAAPAAAMPTAAMPTVAVEAQASPVGRYRALRFAPIIMSALALALIAGGVGGIEANVFPIAGTYNLVGERIGIFGELLVAGLFSGVLGLSGRAATVALTFSAAAVAYVLVQALFGDGFGQVFDDAAMIWLAGGGVSWALIALGLHKRSDVGSAAAAAVVLSSLAMAMGESAPGPYYADDMFFDPGMLFAGIAGWVLGTAMIVGIGGFVLRRFAPVKV